MREAKRLKIPLEEFRTLYQLSLRKPTLLSETWRWTGFNEKKLWDYLQLLIVPVFLAVGAYYLNQLAANRADYIAGKRYEQDQQIAAEKYQQETLSNYLDEMTQLLLDKHLRQADKNSEAWSIARARTITVLWKLDGQRKGQLLQFLREADLISRKRSTVIHLKDTDLKLADLRSADLRYTNLKDSDLRRAHLQYANLEHADLSSTHLEDIDLSNANLKGANLEGANMEKANLRNAIIDEVQLTRTKLCHTVLPNGTESNRNCEV